MADKYKLYSIISGLYDTSKNLYDRLSGHEAEDFQHILSASSSYASGDVGKVVRNDGYLYLVSKSNNSTYSEQRIINDSDFSALSAASISLLAMIGSGIEIGGGGDSNDPVEELPPDNEIWYYAANQVELFDDTDIQSHTFSDGKGVLKFASAVTNVRLWFRDSNVTDVKMPKTVISIETYAFESCKSLALTSLPNELTTIGESVFENCKSLALTSLPSGMTFIDYHTFSNCKSLALTSLPSGITQISDEAFNSCSSLALTSLPNKLKNIGENAFNGCTSLAITTLPSGLKNIEFRAFYECWNTTEHSITFTSTLNYVSEYAFEGNSKLTDIYVPWAEGAVYGAPWGATNATIHYNSNN